MGFNTPRSYRYPSPREGEDYMTALLRESLEEAKQMGDPTKAGDIYLSRVQSLLGKQEPIAPQAPQAPIKEANAEKIPNYSKKRQLIKANRSVKT